ncbi:hypothetical protein [Pandoraea apista]|uniref:hypothetical protein n=1 Tax=Pandoraea apista TaxID=93218 RepID=UPI000657B3D3|nr:hypothetical protein [Pandoraea apista]ALS63596.1 hypothetical protein AT395_00050 [Pandoraea apista]CFB63122.1 hypothetical protein LMG16407_03197 [Pandoraea apista]
MPNDITDLRHTVVPKSDQLNAEQLLTADMTITVTDVRVGGGADQPVSIHYQNDDGRPFKPCKTMRKLLIFAWGEDGRRWIGKSMTLFNEPSVKFGGEVVGGIRISHLSDIEKDIAVSLTSTKGKKAQHFVKRLVMTPAVTLEEVLKAIAAMSDRKSREAAKNLAMQLVDEDDAIAATNAFNARVAELRGPIAPSDSQ